MAKNTKTAKSAVTAEQVADAATAFLSLVAQYNGATAPVAEVEADEDEDEVEDDEDAEEVELTQEMIDNAAAEGIKSLRTLAQEVLGEDAPTKKADILEALSELVEDDEEEDEDEDDEVEEVEDDDEADEDEDEDEDDEEEVEELDEDALNAMSQKELTGLAKELGVKIPKAQQKQSAANKKKIVALILDSGEEE